jgi:cysteine desulfurase family protein
MAYFDNAATTFPKPENVYAYMDKFYRTSGANAGRGKHSMAETAGGLVADTRDRIKKLLHCPAKQVVFTPTATVALNMIIQGIISNDVKNVYISPFEHNAVTRILHYFEETQDIRTQQLSVTDNMIYDLEKIRYQFDNVKPDLVIISHVSNTIGVVAPAEEIFLLAKKYKAFTVLDMAQSAGLIDCNIGLSCFDFAVFAGHKTLYGPTGISGFVMEPSINLPPVLFGGTGYDSANQKMPNSIPEKYEMGTLNIHGIAGLNAALKWIDDVGIDEIRKSEEHNRKKLIELIEEFDFIKIIGDSKLAKYVGIVSCVIDGISSDNAGGIFDSQGIAVRTGLHCAPLAHQFIGTYPAGTIRFSMSYFTNDDDFEALKKALEFIEENI